MEEEAGWESESCSDDELPFFGLGEESPGSVHQPARLPDLVQQGSAHADSRKGNQQADALSSSVCANIAELRDSQVDASREVVFQDDSASRRIEAGKGQADEQTGQLDAWEDAFWASMTPEDAEKMQGMLQAVSLYQQHLQHNEDTISDLHSQIAAKERTHRNLRRRSQQAAQNLTDMQERSAHFAQERDKWTCKLDHYARRSSDTSAYHAKHAALQEERARLSTEAALARAELVDLQDQHGSCEAMCKEQAARLEVLEAGCMETIASIEAEHAAELPLLVAQHAEELSRWEEELVGRVAEQKARDASEAEQLRAELRDTRRHSGQLKQEHEENVENLSALICEGSRLQKQCAEAREEVLDLASQVRAYQEVPRVASQLGMSMDGSMASIEFLPLPGEDPELDAELAFARQECKALEREFQRSRDALEKKRNECERWRKRVTEQRGHLDAHVEEGVVEPSGPADLAPFVLGPEP